MGLAKLAVVPEGVLPGYSVMLPLVSMTYRSGLPSGGVPPLNWTA